jgi:YesN/AraC family two-component response regulator
MRRVLLIDDEVKSRMGIRVILQRSDTEFKDISECDDGLQAENLLHRETFDLVITDIKMPNLDGISFIRRAQSLRYKPKFLILSGYQNFSYAAEALKYGVKEYLLKPIGRLELIESVKKIEDELKSEEALQLKLQGLDQATGSSGFPTMKQRPLSNEKAQCNSTEDMSKIEDAIQYIHKNYNKDINLSTVSNYVSLNYNYCSNLFRSKTGVRFVEYLNHVRIEKAKEILLSRDCMISDVAGLAGFANPKHFTKIFRSITGISPLEYRRQRGKQDKGTAALP